MKNPLRHRFIRELKGDPGKYLVIFLLLVLMISEVSGYLVAGESMIAAYDESFEKYNVEDGNFSTEKRLNRAQEKRIAELGVTLYELFDSEQVLDGGQKIRIFKRRDKVNLECVMEGRLPEGEDELALDRMFATNNDIRVGDVLTSGERSWTVCGLVALPDYSTMFEDNSQTMFDALRFGVAVVSEEAFAEFSKDEINPRYAWKYDGIADTTALTDAELNDLSEEFLKGLSGETKLTDYVPRYVNQAIIFAGNDLGGDRRMIQIFLYIVIVIIAFVFAVTISNTIVKEANVIGTLRASGYTKRELVGHYMFLPVMVTLVAALIGNILGYTAMKGLNASLYYNSYSLTTYETRWSASAFVQTTLLPIAIMLVVNFFILTRRLSLSPLQFLRRDLRRRSKTRALPLSKHLPFMHRFRIRIILQNLSNYVLLFVGILFAIMLLIFGMCMPDVLKNYNAGIGDNMLCNYQYVLKLPSGAVDEEKKLDSMLFMLRFKNAVETENEDAEEFSAYTLKTLPAKNIHEDEIMLYGIKEDSRYIPVTLEGDGVWLSSAYAEKWSIAAGDEITLKEIYEEDTFSFRVDGIYDYEGGLCVFMRQDALNETFDLGKGTFSGYLSDTEITDIDEAYIGQIINLEALTRISRQLDHSMGSLMYVIDAFSIVMFMILIYLLSKVIIEKNAQSISMTKILGYTNGEVASLYVMATSILVVIFLLVSIPIAFRAMTWVFRYYIMSSMAGWIPFHISNSVFRTIFLLGLATYAVVAVLEYFKIARVPMDEALKNVE